MGVPKFFRYISERYPCLSELAREQSIPDFDNLYLDMNGIIHNCSHPDDTNIHFNISEEDMFKDIFNYIDKLFFLIKPQKFFFMAVDGVAPRAKMNQQRSRRFRSAKDAELLEQKSKSRGEIREHERFDSNCITPGTEFMSRLHEALRYFVKSKISTDPMWQKCRVVLSGHDSPGEGEHKIMDYIRYLKSQKDYNPNTRHCLYGLDADLIILGLCTHELHFVVLREEVKFGKKTKRTSVEETRFFLLHLGLLREYLEMEFDVLRQQDATFQIAKLIDDWVLMGFLVGNDFIPHLPCLHISSNALPLLYKTYIKVYPTLGGNINESGKLNLERLEKYFAALSDVEFEIFQENYADLKYFEAKQTKNGIDEAFDFDVSEINNENNDNDLAALIESSRQFLEDEDEGSENEAEHIAGEFETYKRNYYMNKLHQTDMTSDIKREQAIGYVTALQWILDYYYCGVQSWDWYYPHHYSPFISDLQNFKDHKVRFNMGKPFLPFEQLLAVLPAASKELLPTAYRDLMTSPSSELINFYPTDFETDLNGKKQEWEAVVLIPFIDEKSLLRAMKSCESGLNADERDRNKHGPMLQYDHSSESQGSVPGIYALKAIYHVFCTEKPFWASEISISADKSVCVELANAARSVFFPGFPTMKHLKYEFELKHARVKIFDHPSRNENLILLPHKRPGFDDILTVSEKYLNQVVYIGWPHLIKAKVVAISNKDKIIDTEGSKDIEPKIFQLHVKTAEEHLMTRMGIEFNDLTVMVHVRTHIGSSYVCGSQGKITMNDAWSPAVTAYPAQGVVAEIAVHNALMVQHKKVEHLFPVKSTIFFVGNPYFGSEGTVLNPLLVYECGRLKVNITVLPEPDFADAKYIQSQLERDYVNSHQAAATIGIHVKCLGRVTGTVLVIAGARRSNLVDNINKTNIGLQLKYPKQQEERAGYARRMNNQWFYSTKAIELIQTYYDRFPMVIDYLSRSSERNEFCFEADLFPDSIGEGCVEEIVAWLKTQDHMKVEKIACGSKTVEMEAVEKILESIEQLKSLPVKTVKLQVKPHLLLKPDVSLPDMYKARKSVQLFDRVVVVKTTYMVPIGAKGTVVGIYPVSDPNPVRLECVRAVDNFFEVLFDKHLPNGNDIYGIAQERVYKVPESSVLLIFTQENAIQQNDMQDSKITQFVDESILNTSGSSMSLNHQTYINCNIKTKIFEQSSNTNPKQANNQKSSTNAPQPGPFKKGGDDFWMPAANTKVKHTNVPQFPTASSTSNNSNPNINSASISILQKSNAPHERQAETQVLKNLLGLSQDNATTSSASDDQIKQLPQPPKFWRNDSALQQQQPNQPFPNIFPMQPLPAGVAVVPLQTGSPIIQPYQQNSFFPVAPPHMGRIGPNEHVFSPNSLNQKGAFTPLQVVRSNQQASSNKQPAVINALNVQQVQQNLSNITLNAQQISEFTDVSSEKHQISAAPASTKPMDGRKKAPRVPKIGARFDYSN